MEESPYLFLEMLNLEDLIIENRTETPTSYDIVVRVSTPAPVCCLTPPVRNGIKRVKYRDLPMHGRYVTVWVDRQRFLCSCGKTLYQPIPNMNDTNMMTERLVAYIQKRALETTFASLSRELGMDESTVRRIFRRFADRELAKLEIKTPEIMGIDELHILSRFRGVITDVGNRTIVDIIPNRSKQSVIKYLEQMPDKERVKVVNMDMWIPYRDAVRLVLPNAVIVVDKFHVVRMANDAVERIRKEHRLTLPTKTRLRLKDDRWILLRNEEDLTAMNRVIMETWFDQFPTLKMAYEAKAAFRDIWTSKTVNEAKQRIEQWDESLDPQIEDAFFDLRRAMSNWGKEIVAYFDHPYTNAYTEAVNGVARIVNRAGRGYSFGVLRAKMLLNSHATKRKD